MKKDEVHTLYEQIAYKIAVTLIKIGIFQDVTQVQQAKILGCCKSRVNHCFYGSRKLTIREIVMLMKTFDIDNIKLHTNPDELNSSLDEQISTWLSKMHIKRINPDNIDAGFKLVVDEIQGIIAQSLKTIREKCKYKFVDIHNSTGLARSTIGRMECGKWLTLDRFLRLIHFYNISEYIIYCDVKEQKNILSSREFKSALKVAKQGKIDNLLKQKEKATKQLQQHQKELAGIDSLLKKLKT